MRAMSDLLWEPADDAWQSSRLGAFAQRAQPEAVGDYSALWQWSVDEPDAFWQGIWDEFDVTAATSATAVRVGGQMPGTTWFPGATLNYAEHMLRGNGLADDDVAIVAESQSRAPVEVTLAELRDQTRRAAAGLRRLGVGEGDRVVACLPNVPETLVAFLATCSIGAVWSSCAPEFGTRSMLDRWAQIEPKVLLTIDGYRYGAKDLPCGDKIAALRAELPTLEHTVSLPYLDGAEAIPDSTSWDDLLADTDEQLTFTPVPFDHPLYVLFSSGTTGLPKAIVHGHGGVLLEHSKQLGLHLGLGPGDRLFWFSTTGWMMWNFLISSLLVGSSIVVFDGNPGHPDLNTVWSLVDRTDATFAGVAAPFAMSCRSAGLEPGKQHDLSALRGVGSTGAPLPDAGFHWLHEHLDGVPISSISGGTDVCSAFLGGSPVTPVRAGVIPCRQLGWKVQAFDPGGNPVIGVEGELVITEPAPSMPIGFWGDDDGAKYRSAYFETYPGVWHHGDWITIDDDGSSVISGRSDATLNRGGVRLGTADFYAVVDNDPAVADSLVVHLEDPDGGLGELILFAVAAAGHSIDDEATGRLTKALRSELSPRHVPDRFVEMPIVPTTLSGKKLEIPVKRILQGIDPTKAASAGALADPTSIDPYIAWANAR